MVIVCNSVIDNIYIIFELELFKWYMYKNFFLCYGWLVKGGERKIFKFFCKI